jgi:hypothetical protein
VGLAAANLRAITNKGIKAKDLVARLAEHGYHQVEIESSEPNLEDVFLALAV